MGKFLFKPEKVLPPMRYFTPSLAALAICAFGVTTAIAAPGGPSEPPGMERMQCDAIAP
jgi:hypothetical protein